MQFRTVQKKQDPALLLPRELATQNSKMIAATARPPWDYFAGQVPPLPVEYTYTETVLWVKDRDDRAAQLAVGGCRFRSP